MTSEKKPTKARKTYEVLISRHSLDELRQGNVNVVMGLIARPRQITGDASAVLATLTVVEIKNATTGGASR